MLLVTEVGRLTLDGAMLSCVSLSVPISASDLSSSVLTDALRLLAGLSGEDDS